MKKFFRQKRVRVTLAVLLCLITASGSGFYVWLLQTNVPDDDVPLWTIEAAKATEVSTKANGREVEFPGGWVGSLAFSGDGKSLQTGVGDTGGASSFDDLAPPIRWWDVKTGQLLRTCTAPVKTALYVSMSADESRVATIAKQIDEDFIHLWDAKSGKLLWMKKGNFASALALSGDGKYVVGGMDVEEYTSHFSASMTTPSGLATKDHSLKIWDAKTGALLKTIGNRSRSAQIIVFSRDGQFMAVLTSDDTIKVWETKRWVLLKSFSTQSAWRQFIRFTPDAKTLVVKEEGIVLWDWRAAKKQRTLERTFADPEGLTISSDGKFIASGGSEVIYSNRNKFDDWLWRDSAFPSASSYGRKGMVHIWDAGTGKLAKTIFTGDRVFSVAFAPDGKTLASEEFTGRVRLWDTSDLYRKNSNKIPS